MQIGILASANANWPICQCKSANTNLQGMAGHVWHEDWENQPMPKCHYLPQSANANMPMPICRAWQVMFVMHIWEIGRLQSANAKMPMCQCQSANANLPMPNANLQGMAGHVCHQLCNVYNVKMGLTI